MSACGVACVDKVFDTPSCLCLVEHDLLLLVHHVIRLVMKCPGVPIEKKEDVAEARLYGSFAGLENGLACAAGDDLCSVRSPVNASFP